MYVWGHNYYGQLGLGGVVVNNTNQPSTPTQVSGLGTTVKAISSCGSGVANGTSAVRVSAYALLNDGTVKACGWNADGQLGIGGTTAVSTFTTVPGATGIARVVCCSENSHATAFFISATAGVKSVGYNLRGQMGVGSGTASFDTPQSIAPLASSLITDLVAFDGSQYTSVLALVNDGTIRAWGYNLHGQLGLGSGAGTGNQLSVTTPNIQNVAAIAMGGNSQKVCTALLQKVDAFDPGAPKYRVFTCGNNEQGALGLGDKVNRNVFTRTLLDSLEVAQIGFGANNDTSVTNTCAFLVRLRNGSALACGFDGPNYGQLGVDATPSPLTVLSYVNL